MTDPATVPRLGHYTWTVYTSWRADGVVPAAETSETHPDWPTARRQALSLACCRGARYVTVCGPGDVVVGDWDRYTNHWRTYPHPLGACDNEQEPDGEPCPGELYVRPGEPQVRCGTCGAWTGTCATNHRRNLMLAIGPPVWCAGCGAWQGQHLCGAPGGPTIVFPATAENEKEGPR